MEHLSREQMFFLGKYVRRESREVNLRKVLVVDDSKAIRSILRRILTEVGFEVAEAEDGVEALKALKDVTSEYALLCTDYNMPNMNGIDLLRRVRRLPHCKGVPAIMITTETHAQSIQNAISAGASEYLMKPFTSEMVKEKLRSLGLCEEGGL